MTDDPRKALADRLLEYSYRGSTIIEAAGLMQEAAEMLRAPNPAVDREEWQDISTAPKDGTDIIVYRPTADEKYIPKVGVDYWSKKYGDVWARSNAASQPTLWRPLPSPPCTTLTKGEVR